MLYRQIAGSNLAMCPWRLTGVPVAVALQGPDLLIQQSGAHADFGSMAPFESQACESSDRSADCVSPRANGILDYDGI
jgi:hypothetical protein